MDIDFHHAVIYVLARYAGFSNESANIISTSSQFVDDAIWNFPINFKTKEIFRPLSSAHKMLDYRNFNDLANRISWVSFHFLPGNLGLPSVKNTASSLDERLICVQDSYLANSLIDELITNTNYKNKLYRFGIALHTFADTWAHEGFSGIESFTNKVNYVDDEVNSLTLKNKTKDFFGDIFDNSLGRLIETINPLGHGAVLGFPDKPYLNWKYINYRGKVVSRNNSEIFLDCAKKIFAKLQLFSGKKISEVVGLPYNLENKLRLTFEEEKSSSGKLRHQNWLDKIRFGYFDFGKEIIFYNPNNENSWTYQAFGTNELSTYKKHDFTEKFMNSHWRYFQEALIDHHYFVTRVLFPRYRLFVM